MLTTIQADEILKTHRLASAGAPLAGAEAVIVALHGRGADARSILGLADVIAQPNVAFVAPQARFGAWYPQSFLAPIASNEPYLGEALTTVSMVLDSLRALGVAEQRIGLMGFSQGACLAVETAIRYPRAFGAIIAFSGGYIGPLDDGVRAVVGRLDGVPAFVGCSDIDAHIPLRRVKETSAHLVAMGSHVTERIYPGFGHAVNDDEIAFARSMLARMVSSA
jgi:phospholipase/carboxylesterase